MPSLTICQSVDSLYLNSRGGKQILLHNHFQPTDLVRALQPLILSEEIQATYAALRQAELEATRIRVAWVNQLAESLAPIAESYLANAPITHAECFL